MIDTDKVFTPGTVKVVEISRVWAKDPKDPKGARSSLWPEYFELSGYVGADYRRVIARVGMTLREIPKVNAYDSVMRRVEAIILSDDDVMAVDFKQVVINGWNYQSIQAELFEKHGYEGPIPGGTARGLANVFKALDMPDNVRRGYFDVKTTVKNPYNGYEYEKSRRTHCYVFKSPRPELKLKDFVRLSRAYREGKGLLAAVKNVITATGDDFKQTLETLDTLDVLAGLGE